MKLQQILSYVRRAVDEYGMINEGDKIAVGISGGKDSLTLLLALDALRVFYPKKFELAAITVSLGFDADFSRVISLCRELNIEYHIIETDIGPIVFDYRKEQNPCSLCSKMRKGALNDAARQIGCTRVALGHNTDDIIETLFMSMFFEGRIHTFAPVTHLDRTGLYSIRPLMYVSERDVISFTKKQDLPVVISPCPIDKNTKRHEMKEFIREQNLKYDGFSDRIFGAVKRSRINGWDKDERQLS